MKRIPVSQAVEDIKVKWLKFPLINYQKNTRKIVFNFMQGATFS